MHSSQNDKWQNKQKGIWKGLSSILDLLQFEKYKNSICKTSAQLNNILPDQTTTK